MEAFRLSTDHDVELSIGTVGALLKQLHSAETADFLVLGTPVLDTLVKTAILHARLPSCARPKSVITVSATAPRALVPGIFADA